MNFKSVTFHYSYEAKILCYMILLAFFTLTMHKLEKFSKCVGTTEQ